jgi:hypothetical protein
MVRTFALAIVSVVLAVGVARSAHADSSLFTNWNNGGVLSNPNRGTPVVLTATTTHITQIATYHYNGGQGAVPGTIYVRTPDAHVYAFPAQGSGGRPNVNWVATTNLTVTAGTYAIYDSDPRTWSFNYQSGNYGFVAVRGDQTFAPAPPPPAPPAAPRPSTPPVVVPATCAPGTPALPAFQPAAQVKFPAWVNPCTFAFTKAFCQRYGLSAVVVRSGFYYVGMRAYPQILVGCV